MKIAILYTIYECREMANTFSRDFERECDMRREQERE